MTWLVGIEHSYEALINGGGQICVNKKTYIGDGTDILTTTLLTAEECGFYLDGYYPAFMFQNYILDYFESVVKTLQDSSYDYIFVERCPVEGILFFAKLDLDNGRLTLPQYEYLLHRSQSLTFYPNPLTCDYVSFNTDNKTEDTLRC